LVSRETGPAAGLPVTSTDTRVSRVAALVSVGPGAQRLADVWPRLSDMPWVVPGAIRAWGTEPRRVLVRHA
jgi:hypothetical protein